LQALRLGSRTLFVFERTSPNLFAAYRFLRCLGFGYFEDTGDADPVLPFVAIASITRDDALRR